MAVDRLGSGARRWACLEPRDTIEDVIEPYLIQLGLIARTARGRCLNGRGYTHLGLTPPQIGQGGLFDPEHLRNNAIQSDGRRPPSGGSSPFGCPSCGFSHPGLCQDSTWPAFRPKRRLFDTAPDNGA